MDKSSLADVNVWRRSASGLSGRLALSMVALCVACTPEPAVRFATGEVSVTPSTQRGATVCVDFHLFDAAGEPTRSDGSLLVEWMDRPLGTPSGTGQATWSRATPITSADYHDYIQGGGRVIFGCRDDCVPPGPGMAREIRVTFTPTGGVAFPPVLATGPFPQSRWVEEHYPTPPPVVFATPAELEPLRVFSRELVAALALAEAAGPRRCEGISEPPASAPLVDREDIQALDAAMSGRVWTIPTRDRRSHPRFQRLVGLLANTLPVRPDEVAASAAELAAVGPLIWIRAVHSRTDGQVVPGSSVVPDHFEPGVLRGALTLVDRRGPAVLCQAGFVATNSPTVSVMTHVESGHATIEGEPLRLDLDARGGDALSDARTALFDDPNILRFEPDVAAPPPPAMDWPTEGERAEGFEPTF